MTRVYFLIYAVACLIVTAFKVMQNQKLQFYFSTVHNLANSIFLYSPYLIFLLLVFFVLKKGRKILLFIFVLLVFYTFYPFIVFGKTNHSMHTFLYGTLGLLFIDPNYLLHDRRNLYKIRILQSALLSTYFSAGISKVIGVLRGGGSFDDFFRSPLQHIAYSYAEGNGPMHLLYSNLTSSWLQNMLCVGFIFVVAFELFAIVVLFRSALIKYYGVAIILFHLCCGMALGIWFFEAIIASLFFLVITEYFLKPALTEQRPS